MPRNLRRATPAQLWCLNRAAKLKLVEDEELEPVSNAQADAAIRRSMAKDTSNHQTELRPAAADR